MEWLQTIIVRLENKINASDNEELVARCINMLSRANMVYERTNGTYFVR